MELEARVSAVVSDVYAEVVALRLRDVANGIEYVRNDSSRLGFAIRNIATRRNMAYRDIEASLDSALAYRVAR